MSAKRRVKGPKSTLAYQITTKFTAMEADIHTTDKNAGFEPVILCQYIQSSLASLYLGAILWC